MNIEYEKNKQKLENLITERTDITPLLGLDWMKTFKLTIGRIQLAENNQSEKEKIINRLPDLFENKPNMEELSNQILVVITRDRTIQLFISKTDLDYAYGQMKLSEETSRQCVFA